MARRLGKGLPRHPGRLRHHRRRYGYRPHRPDVRCRRRQRGPRRRHSLALHAQPQGRNPPDGRPDGQVLPARRAGRALRPRVRRRRGLPRIRGPLGQECLRPAVHRRRPLRRKGGTGGRVARHLHLHASQGGRKGIQNREACPQLPPLLAYGQAGALLPARLVVHPHHGAARA